MFGCDSSAVKRAVVGVLVCIVHGDGAVAQGAVPAPAVTVSPVVSHQVTETADFVGRVVAINKVDVVARVPGFIEERNFTEGQQVKTGDLLFRIEQDTYKAAVDQQKANVAKAKATEVNAALQLHRGKELIHNQTIPQSTLDQREADEAAAQAEVLQAEALLQQAQINLGYTEIRSPIDGRVGLAIFTVGNLVEPSSGKLATIVSQDPIYVTFPASERDVIAYRHRLAEFGRHKSAPARSYQTAGRDHLWSSRPHQLSRRPGRDQHRHRDCARGISKPGRSPRSGRDRRGRGGHWATKIGTPSSAIRYPARPGRPLRPGGRWRKKGRAAAGDDERRARSQCRRDRRSQGGRTGYRRGNSEGPCRPGRVGKRRAE